MEDGSVFEVFDGIFGTSFYFYDLLMISLSCMYDQFMCEFWRDSKKVKEQ